MIPLRDYLPTRRPAIINTSLIVLNIAIYVHFFGLALTPSQARFEAALPYTLIPIYVSHGLAPGTLVTSIFMHASLLHLAGNMLFLYIFGNNVEDAIGRVRYVIFFLLAGIGGGLLEVVVDPGSGIPSLGASGAIAGVLAAYAVLYPRARVGTLILLGFIPLFLRLRAWVVIGIWALLQFLSGYAEFGVPHRVAHGGVGYFAHIGGFMAGLVLLRLMRPKRRLVQL